METLYFLIGPTAVGKTALGIEWARANNTEILCADAPLVYKGMNTGTAKPTPDEQKLVPHHCLDWITVRERFSVGDYAERAAEVVREVHARGKNILIVGGSGFYLKSFFEKVTDGIVIHPEISKKAESVFETAGLVGLLAELRRVGGENLDGLDIQNPRRVIKALERCLASGKSFAQIRQEFLAQKSPYDNFQKKVVMLSREKEELRQRIIARVDSMLAAGLIDEVSALKSQGLAENPQAASVIGYRETLAFLNGLLSLEALKAEIVEHTMELVRKQITFFKLLPVDKIVTPPADIHKLFDM